MPDNQNLNDVKKKKTYKVFFFTAVFQTISISETHTEIERSKKRSSCEKFAIRL